MNLPRARIVGGLGLAAGVAGWFAAYGNSLANLMSELLACVSVCMLLETLHVQKEYRR